jgi:hypothetical protein
LDVRYAAARNEAAANGHEKLLDIVEDVTNHSCPVITVSLEACDDLLRPGKYRSYHQRVKSYERDPATPASHADRQMVGERLFPNFSDKLHYAALSPNGHGLLNYGSITLSWRVTTDYLENRISLLEENSYVFFGRHGLGRVGAVAPQGHQAVWSDRAKLSVAKLSADVNPAMTRAELTDLLFRSGADRNDDRFIEILIYDERGLDAEFVFRVTLEGYATTRIDQYRLDIIKEQCSSRRIEFVG